MQKINVRALKLSAHGIWVTCGALLLGGAMTSCGGDYPRVDTTGHEVTLSIEPFYKDLFANPDEGIDSRMARLSQTYGSYFDAFCAGELRIGQQGTPECAAELERFLSAPENPEVLAACDSAYAQIIKSAEADLSEAFSCFGALFPSQPVPTNIFCHFSGFNDRLFVDSTYVSFGIEHYLGANCRFYNWLQIPVYARQTRRAENLVSDILRGWVYASMPDMSGSETVLSALIYQGKVTYALHRCLPSAKLNVLMGLSADQLEWCRRNERNMWGYMAEHKLLYSTNMMDRNKLVNEAPFTAFFGQMSPGRAAIFCAYNIVKSYMTEHPNVTLEQLMDMSDAQKILAGSRYNP